MLWPSTDINQPQPEGILRKRKTIKEDCMGHPRIFKRLESLIRSLVKAVGWWQLVSNCILTSCQAHKVTSEWDNDMAGGSERGSEETKLNGAGKGEGIFIFLRNPFAHHFNHTFGFQALLKNTSTNSLVLELSLTLSPSSWMPYHEQSGKQIPLWCSPDLEKLHLFSDWLSFSSLLDSLCTTTFLCKTFSILCTTTFLCKTFSIYLLFLLKKKNLLQCTAHSSQWNHALWQWISLYHHQWLLGTWQFNSGFYLTMD